MLPGEALTGLKAGRSVSGISCSQERRAGLEAGISVSDLWNDPSRGFPREFLAPRRGAHRAGGWNIRLGPLELNLLRRGARRAGGWKICLGDFLLPGEALTGWRLEDPSRGFLAPRRGAPGWRLEDPSRGIFCYSGRSVSGISCSQERRSPGVGKIRLGDFFPGEALTGLEVGNPSQTFGIKVS